MPSIYPAVNAARVVLRPDLPPTASAGRSGIFDRKLLLVTDSRQRLDWLQVLRGVAAAGVVVSHGVEYLAPDAPGRWLVGALNHLGSGVDLFFVISGFIMVMTTAGKSITPMDFITRRFIRVVPLYWVLTLALWPGF